MRISALPLAFLLANCAGNPGLNPTAMAPAGKPMLSSADVRPLSPAEKQALGRTLAKGLKDPDSAKFEWTGFPRNPGPGVVHYCAMVNAKNSYGGYTGSKPFIAVILMDDNKSRIIGGALAAVASQRDDDQIIRKMCRDEGLDPYLIL